MPPSKINVLEAVDRKVKEVFHPFIVGDVNDRQHDAQYWGRGECVDGARTRPALGL
jgi:hypothetical protein